MNIGNAVLSSQNVSDYLENGGSRDMSVNGSVTPVVFTLELPADGKDYCIYALQAAFNATAPLQSGNSFLNLPALTNGIEYGAIARSGDTEIPIRGTIKNNLDIFSRDPRAVVHDMAGNDTVLSASLQAGLFLVLNSSVIRAIYAKIQDDLSAVPWVEMFCRIFRVIPQRR